MGPGSPLRGLPTPELKNEFRWPRGPPVASTAQIDGTFNKRKNKKIANSKNNIRATTKFSKYRRKMLLLVKFLLKIFMFHFNKIVLKHSQINVQNKAKKRLKSRFCTDAQCQNINLTNFFAKIVAISSLCM